jgi:hypothetical protein
VSTNLKVDTMLPTIATSYKMGSPRAYALGDKKPGIRRAASVA